MPQQFNPTVENHFIAGLKTEFTGLNFPENAATDTQNCVFSLIGDVTRRGGINYEPNFALKSINQSSVSKSSYRWKNVGGDGSTQILVQQMGATLYFFNTTSATPANPVSTQLLTSTINLENFRAVGNVNSIAQTECQFADGNGFLLVFHPNMDSIYCTFNSVNSVITPYIITINIRDVFGIPEGGIPDNFRPATLSQEHLYNLTNQGWTKGSTWSGQLNANGGPSGGSGTYVGDSWTLPVVSQTNTSAITNGSQLRITGTTVPGPYTSPTTILATVTNYVTPFTSITVTVVSITGWPDSSAPGAVGWGVYSGGVAFYNPNQTLSASLVNQGFITTWFGSQANYPSNSDVWWAFKDTTGAFNPGLMAANTQQNIGAAPKGTYILNAFQQTRSNTSGITGLTDTTTTQRASTGAWYQGRIFYSGVNASYQPTGDAPYYTWSENIYFSQIIETPAQFSKCYQVNDPTAQNLFSILPTDGGVITIQGCGAIYKLFALRFGLLVFASNGIWFIGGSQGVGFSANDYTVTKISSIASISGTSFIDVMGLPLFWNNEGIYQVVPSQQPGSAHSPDIQLDVQNLTLGTILTFYDGIPLVSKAYARGDYDQINYVIQWCYKSVSETGIADRYNYDRVLNYNAVTKAFYVYTLPSSPIVNDVKWIQNPGAIGEVLPIFKYTTVDSNNNLTFSEENDFTRYLDFFSFDSKGQNFISFFTTGYKLAGQALRKFEVPYVYFFSRNPGLSQYLVQSIWDYAGSGNSGRWSTVQRITNSTTNFSMLYRRLRLRGRGMAMQLKITSVQGQPFDLMGWSVWSYANTGIS